MLGRFVGANAVDRVRRLIESATATGNYEKDAFVVIADDWGPFLAKRVTVGQVVERSREACVVIPVGLAADVARNTQRRIA